jgi:hypothetical protein
MPTANMPPSPRDEAKIKAIRQYLTHHFQALNLYDIHDPVRLAQIFRVYHAEPPLSYTVVVSQEFFRDHATDEILPVLERWQLAEVMRGAGIHEVLLTSDGPRIADD